MVRDELLASLTMTLTPDIDSGLSDAIAQKLPAATIVAALLQAEKTTKGDRRQFPRASLMGNWRLCFSTMGKVKLGDKRLRGFYLPSWLPAQIGFAASGVEAYPISITNQITVGLVSLKLSGPAKFIEKKNLIGFDFTQIEVKILGQTVYNGKFPSPREGKVFGDISIGKLPFFAFFAVTEQFIAARGRGGGLAIWVKAD
jgi:hypothetical protein